MEFKINEKEAGLIRVAVYYAEAVASLAEAQARKVESYNSESGSCGVATRDANESEALVAYRAVQLLKVIAGCREEDVNGAIFELGLGVPAYEKEREL